MNPNARTKRIETMLNQSEVTLLDTIRGHVDRSPFLRGLMYAAARTNGIPPAPPKESRGCRGNGRIASRASSGMMVRRQL